MDHHRDWDAPLITALLVWLCALPLVGLFILPIFGIQVAAAVAVLLLLLALLVCWALCSWPGMMSGKEVQGRRG
jgi:hypothetical protein